MTRNVKVRVDAWSHDEDVLLREIVLKYVAEGKTQTSAFEEIAKRLHRTAEAVGFRFNSKVRYVIQNELHQAKILGRQSKANKQKRLNELLQNTDSLKS
jgi:prespore-specific regulator